MIQPETFDHGNPIFIQPGEHESSPLVPYDFGPATIRDGYVPMYKARTCPTDGCLFDAGYEDSPLCEGCSWKLFAKLEKAEELKSKREAARAEYIEWEFQERCKEEAATLTRIQRWRDTTVKNPGWIYYLQVGELIKIGYTADLYQRLASYPPNSKLLATHPGTLSVERQMHHKFLHRLSNGREWFAPADDLNEHIATVKRDFKQHTLVA